MFKNLVIAFLFLISMALQAQVPAGYAPVQDLSLFSTRFTDAAKKTKSIRSDFMQEKTMTMLSEKIISKGKFSFKKENKVRMEYITPFRYLMIINGTKVYIRDGKKESTISTSSNKIFRQVSQIMLDCVSGTVLSNTDFSVRVFENKTNYLIEMTPVSRGMKEFFKTIQVYAGKSDYSVEKVDMIELSGDFTTLNFTNKEINSELPDAVFTLQ
ncbi:MAG TPA: outer membrane lipoprotein carrier protein LolA [Bacteroidia bacterium]|nr:outer membrane lipoprotein carrier protein LolA [Bacteroidia bacterium]